MKELSVELESRSYIIKVGYDFLESLGEELKRLGFKGQLLVITDENVFPLYGTKCLRGLESAGFSAKIEVVPAGEGSKSWPAMDKLLTSALEFGMDRDSGIVALGGGVVGDLAGFVAATYLRGVSYVQVPTTLLAQVDSSVGGKVAINHPRAKNMIGAFYQPQLVFIDLKTLETLPERELRSGMAEVVKYGIIRDRDFFDYLLNELTLELKQTKDFYQSIVYRSCAIKAEVVSVDERESGLRAILNFGHTLGHTLESSASYKYFNHGEAVNYGMLLASRLACSRGLLDRDSLTTIEKLLFRLGFKELPSDLTVEGIKEGLKYDKKRREGKIVFILPEEIGKVREYTDIPGECLDWLITDFLKEFKKK
ncbi:3-dehydroquinate synthase [Candidatus Contubernalis alkalaceticus]|nr:3-dehydroquinate synthase [Candidatus Contubernalis alkalaceticus]